MYVSYGILNFLLLLDCIVKNNEDELVSEEKTIHHIEPCCILSI